MAVPGTSILTIRSGDGAQTACKTDSAPTSRLNRLAFPMTIMANNLAPAFSFDQLLDRLPRPKDDGAFLGYHDLLAGTWIVGLAGFPPTYLEDAEVAEFEPAFCNHGIDDRREGLINDALDSRSERPEVTATA